MHTHKTIIGVMGGGSVPQEVIDMAFELGARIASHGWVLLNGGRDAGVMRASAEGAKSRGGLVIGVLPGHNRREANPFIDLPIVTNMGDARNVINVLSSDVVVALPGGTGTLSEIALALKNAKPVCLLGYDDTIRLGNMVPTDWLYTASRPDTCITLIEKILSHSAP